MIIKAYLDHFLASGANFSLPLDGALGSSYFAAGVLTPTTGASSEYHKNYLSVMPL